LAVDGPDDVGQADVGRGLGEPEATVRPALQTGQPGAAQGRHDGLNELARDILGVGELLRSDVAV
jgi:hypothetical protein